MLDHRIQGCPTNAIGECISLLSAEALFDTDVGVLDKSFEVKLTGILSFAPPYGGRKLRKCRANYTNHSGYFKDRSFDSFCSIPISFSILTKAGRAAQAAESDVVPAIDMKI